MLHQKRTISAMAITIITCTSIFASQNKNEHHNIKKQILDKSSPAMQDARGYASILALAGGFCIAHGIKKYFVEHFDTLTRQTLKRQALLPIGMGFVFTVPLGILVYDLEHKVSKQIELNKQTSIE